MTAVIEPGESFASPAMGEWSAWQPFPDPRVGGFLFAPFGAGVYELRHRSSGQGILFGEGGHLALRMSSLLPKPHGCGTRKNEAKRSHVLRHLADVEYRTAAFATKAEAVKAQGRIKARRRIEPDAYIFWT